MNKAELESKHLADLHALAAEAGIPKYRMLPRGELIQKLADEKPQQGRSSQPKQERKPREPRQPREPSQPRESSPAPERPRRKRRRRRWGRRRREMRIPDLLLPATPGRQVIVHAESREACTALLREVAAELSDASKGPDPIALLVDPSPEELADWKREAPQVEIVSAGQARHADDALAQAANRADASEDVIVLVDSLTRFAESFGDDDSAKEVFDAGLGRGRSGNGSLTVVAAVERRG